MEDYFPQAQQEGLGLVRLDDVNVVLPFRIRPVRSLQSHIADAQTAKILSVSIFAKPVFSNEMARLKPRAGIFVQEVLDDLGNAWRQTSII